MLTTQRTCAEQQIYSNIVECCSLLVLYLLRQGEDEEKCARCHEQEVGTNVRQEDLVVRHLVLA